MPIDSSIAATPPIGFDAGEKQDEPVAQVNQGHVATLEDSGIKLQYDFYYIKYFSYRLDVLIVMRTIHTSATGFGSK